MAAAVARILTDFTEIAHLWPSGPALCGTPQSFAWIDNWRRHANADCFVAGLFEAGRPILLLPLEAVTQSGVAVARYPGGNHANCNFPWLDPAHPVDRAALERLIAAIGKARPDLAALSLTRQLSALRGTANPLLALGQSLNPNPMLAASLGGGFDAVLERGNRKRRLKKHRQHERRYEEAGGWRIAAPRDRAESDRVLDLFFAMKAVRFRQMGIADPFAEAGVQAFFKALFAETGELRFLEAGGIVRSVIGKTCAAEGPTVEFGAIAEDELSNASPGEFLFFEDIRESCEKGLAVYSFGIGDEPYKRDWCDLEFAVYDTAVPLSARGRIFTALQSGRNGVAGAIKRHPRLWPLVKYLRSKFG